MDIVWFLGMWVDENTDTIRLQLHKTLFLILTHDFFYITVSIFPSDITEITTNRSPLTYST